VESIGDILKRLEIQRSTPGADTGTSSSRNSTPVCPECGGAGYLRLDVPVDDPRFGSIVPCACKEREIAERRSQRLLEKSNLRALAGMTFESFIQQDAPLKNAFKWARQYAMNPDGWLVIMGGYGTGKTHLAAAIGNYRLAIGEPALFMVVPDLLDHLRSAYAPGSELDYDDFFEGVRQAQLLILDDLGTQTSTPWASEKLFQLFNHRTLYRLPTVITTNNSLDEINPRLASRMSDPMISTCVMIDSRDFRGAVGASGEPGSSAPRGPRRRLRGVEYTDRP
jgi:DNA replication protein DnaC